MRLIDDLRATRPVVEQMILKKAEDQWHLFTELTRRAAANGASFVTLTPAENSPFYRGVAAAVAARAETEGFRVERIVREPSGFEAAQGARPCPAWRCSW